MDIYYGSAPGTTKTIKSKHVPDLELDDVDNKTTEFHLWTKIFKVFTNVEYKGRITRYENESTFYQILYKDGNAEDEVRDSCTADVKRHPKTKIWKHKTNATVPNFCQKFHSTTNDMYNNVMPVVILISNLMVSLYSRHTISGALQDNACITDLGMNKWPFQRYFYLLGYSYKD